MKNTCKFVLAASLLAGFNTFGQAWIPNGNPLGGINGVNAGNNFLGTNGGNLNDVRMGTFGLTRMTMFSIPNGAQLQNYPGSLLNPLPGRNLTRIGISRDAAAPITAPLSLLHIGYNSGIPGVELAHRSWQDIGTMYVAETDNFYVGMRQKDPNDPTGRGSTVLTNPTNAQDAVLTWGDNYSGLTPPPDNNLAFIFQSSPAWIGTVVPQGTDYGLEVMRMNGEGHVGIGPVFFDNAQPQNLLHINSDVSNPAYLQISNAGTTGQTANDGFYLGVSGTGEAQLRQRENLDMQFFTNNSQRAVITNNGDVGINIGSPGNKLEINSAVANASGLRFTNLTSASPAGGNPGNGVLAVDAAGDVIYVTGGGGGSALGNNCGNPQNPITSDYELPTAGFNFYYPDDNAQKDKVNVGYVCGSSTIGKLNASTRVLTNPSPVPGVSPESAAIYGISDVQINNITNVGVMGECNNQNAGNAIGYGVWGKANFADVEATGVRGTSELKNKNYNYGGSFYAAAAQQYNIGVNAIARPSTGITPPQSYTAFYPNANIGIYAAGDPANSNSGAPQQDWAAWFDGDVNINGVGYINSGFWIASDNRYKKNIKKLEGINDKLKKLSGYTYNFRAEEFKRKGFEKTEQIGLIAQELKEVFPQLVREDATGYLTVNYQGMVPVLLEAAKEQQSQIEKQQQQIDELKALVQSIAGTTPGKTTSIPVTLNDNMSVVLNQNVPNPFAESTTITYNIPSDFNRAQIIFSTVDGTVIKTVDIKEKGPGSLNVFANDLSHGTYVYTLVVDGKTIDTKKMIKE